MSVLSRLLKSQSIRAAITFAAGGFGFAAGNLVLAAVLPPVEFGIVALLLALNQFGLTLGAMGMDVVVNRHRPLLDGTLARALLLPALATAALMSVVAGFYYGLALAVVLPAFVMIVASTVNKTVAGLYQAERRMLTAMTLLQVHNYTLLAAAGLVIALNRRDAVLVMDFIALSYLCTAAWGWWQARRTMTADRHAISLRRLFAEGFAVVGLSVAVQVLFQFERLAIPKLASMELLGTYAVLAAVAGSPYRMIQLGNSFTLLPRMRAAPDAQAARRVLKHEGLVALVVTVASTIAIAVFAPLVFHYALHDRYDIGQPLLVVAYLMGGVRVWEGFSSTTVSALGSPARLAQLSIVGWVALGVAVVGTVVGARFGLVGVLYGTLAAWMVLAGGGTWLARRALRERFAPGAAA